MAVRNHRKTLLASMLFIAWIGMTAYAFWWFEFKNLRIFDTTAAGAVIQPNSQTIYHVLMAKLPKEDRQVSVVHFWNPDCYCNRFNLVHLREIMAEYRGKKVRFYVAVAAARLTPELEKRARKAFGDIQLISINRKLMRHMIPSTPSAAVLNPGKGITYFGPYSQGAVCSSQNGSFVETVLNASLAGNVSAQQNTLAFGCYCDW